VEKKVQLQNQPIGALSVEKSSGKIQKSRKLLSPNKHCAKRLTLKTKTEIRALGYPKKVSKGT